MNWKTFPFLGEWFPPCSSTPHHGWLFRLPHLSWPLNHEKILFGQVVVVVKLSIYLRNAVWGDSTFCCLPSCFPEILSLLSWVTVISRYYLSTSGSLLLTIPTQYDGCSHPDLQEFMKNFWGVPSGVNRAGRLCFQASEAKITRKGLFSDQA